MDTFLNAVQQKGGHIDFMCLHWYLFALVLFRILCSDMKDTVRGWDELARFNSYPNGSLSLWQNIWITEVGITSASHPSQSKSVVHGKRVQLVRYPAVCGARCVVR